MKSMKTRAQTTAGSRRLNGPSSSANATLSTMHASRIFVRASFGLSTVFARPSEDNAPGIITHYVESIKHRTPIRLPAGVDPVRDILYVDDFSQGLPVLYRFEQLSSGFTTLAAGQLNALSLRDILKRVGAMIEIEPVIQEDPAMPVPGAFALRFRHHAGQRRIWVGGRGSGVDDGLRMIL